MKTSKGAKHGRSTTGPRWDANMKIGISILLITHEMGVVRAIADRVAVLDGGRIVEQGPVWRVFATPQSATTKSLLRAYQPVLPEWIAARLVEGVGKRTIVKVLTVGAQARAPLLAGLALDTGVIATLIQGGVDYVQSYAIGAQFLELDGGESFASAINYLIERASEVEVLGHVVGDD